MQTETQQPTYYTFNTKGLSDVQIKFLAEVEKLWFDGAESSTETLTLAYEKAGYVKGAPEAEPCLKAWSYWQALKQPLMRSSLKKPVTLSSLLSFSPTGRWLRFPNVHMLKVTETEELKKLVSNNIAGLSFYYEVINNKHFYFQYDQIIGGRFIAVIENDIPQTWINTWYQLGMQNYWISRTGDPDFTKECIVICNTIEALEAKIKDGNWCTGQGFAYKNLCFIEQTNGNDEWLTIKEDVAFESFTFGGIIKRGQFKNYIEGMLQATKAECKALDYTKYIQGYNL